MQRGARTDRPSQPGCILQCALLCAVISGCGRLSFELQQDTATDAADDATTDAPASQFTATHAGWVHVSAVGTRLPKPTPQMLPATALKIDLSWTAMIITPASAISEYSVLRSNVPAGPYQLLGTATAEDPAPTHFVDDTAAEQTTYYYVVRPIIDGIPVPPSGSDAELELPTPPANMALVHRWMANREVCSLLGQSTTVDRSNHYRCAYTGPGRIDYTGDIGEPPTAQAYYDIGAHHFVDIVETGCNYTLSSSGCPGNTGAPGPCLGAGAAAPDAAANQKAGNIQTGNEGDVFYDRGSSICYYKNATSWMPASAPGTTDGERSLMAANIPGLPPLVLISQSASSAVCQQQLVGTAAKRLMSRKLQIATSAWDPQLAPEEIAAIESGTGPSDCNSDMGHPGELTFDDGVEPGDYATLPGTLANGFGTLRTGAAATSACRSRYGVQDLSGNLWEWVSDQSMSSSSGTVFTGVVSTLAPNNRDFADIVLTRAAGGGGNEWNLSAADRFLPALGLPADSSAPNWQAALPTASVELSGDRIFMSTDTNELRATYIGGSASASTWAGRFALNLSRSPNTMHARIGFRCAVPSMP